MSSATRVSPIVLMCLADRSSAESDDEMWHAMTKYFTVSQTPRWWWACSGSRKDDPKLRTARTAMRLSSCSGESKLRGIAVVPWSCDSLR